MRTAAQGIFDAHAAGASGQAGQNAPLLLD